MRVPGCGLRVPGGGLLVWASRILHPACWNCILHLALQNLDLDLGFRIRDPEFRILTKRKVDPVSWVCGDLDPATRIRDPGSWIRLANIETYHQHCVAISKNFVKPGGNPANFGKLCYNFAKYCNIVAKFCGSFRNFVANP